MRFMSCSSCGILLTSCMFSQNIEPTSDRNWQLFGEAHVERFSGATADNPISRSNFEAEVGVGFITCFKHACIEVSLEQKQSRRKIFQCRKCCRERSDSHLCGKRLAICTARVCFTCFDRFCSTRITGIAWVGRIRDALLHGFLRSTRVAGRASHSSASNCRE